MYSSTLFAAAMALVLGFVVGHPTTPAVQLRLRGGGMLSSLGDALGWKREAVGSNELGCGPLPQVKAIDRHTAEGAKMKKKHEGDGYTRSHSVIIPDVAGQR
mmetsp:Transcript_33921/g.49686  ORF Transcript_33921/g.49686 Transcript_33921/m.49686 type:complete len:102 (+) Transcript_33921:55-360(+)